MTGIESIQIGAIGTTKVESKGQQTPVSNGFDFVFESIQNMNQTQVDANALMTDVLLGKSDDTHGALIALEKASIQMQLMVKVRDQLTESYNKLINIQI